MRNLLIDKGLLFSNGQVCKNNINMLSGRFTLPFAEMVWATTGGDMETINRITDVLITMNTSEDREKLFKIIKMVYWMVGLKIPEEINIVKQDSDVLEYFIHSFILDFKEVISEYVEELAESKYKDEL